MTEVCRLCGSESATPVKIGLEHVNSTGGHDVFACPICVLMWALLPYDEHPEGSDGRPLTRHGTLLVI